MKLLVGGDPEFFLRNKDNGEFLSATEFDIPGTKRKPHPVKKGAVQVDGTALEINIDPASTAEEFSTNLTTVIGEARAFVPKNIEFVFTPVVEYEKKYFKTIPKASLELGCDPDYDADRGERNNNPAPVGTMRTGAGHISLGWGNAYDPLDAAHFWDCREMTKRLRTYFDAFKPLWDLDRKRQNMYGAGAAFRPKPFGVEFRTLSNAWVGRPELYPWIFDSVKWIFDHAVAGKQTKQYSKIHLSHGNYAGYDKKMAPIIKLNTLPQRINNVNAYITDIFGDDFPPFPAKGFVPATYPKVEVAYQA